MIFAARIDTLQRVSLCQGDESGGAHGLALHLSFYWEANDSYRDIYLKKPKESKEQGQHRKKLSELIA